MPLMDKTGRNLRKGQLVDCFLTGRFTGEVVAIDEGAVLVGNHTRPPMVAVTIHIPFAVQGNTCPGLYVVKAAPLTVADTPALKLDVDSEESTQ